MVKNIILLDMDGVLLPQSEHIFATVIERILKVEKSKYADQVLLRGINLTANADKEKADQCFAEYNKELLRYLTGTGNEELRYNESILRLLKSQPDVELHLISNSPEEIGKSILITLGWDDIFSKTIFGAGKFGNAAFYKNYVSTIPNGTRIAIVEDSLFHVTNIEKFAKHGQTRMEVFFIVNPLYFWSKTCLKQVEQVIDDSSTTRAISSFSELVSLLFPLRFPITAYARFPLASAEALGDELGLSMLLYREIYNCRTHLHFDCLDEESFTWVQKREYFVIFALIAKDPNGAYTRVLMKMDFATGSVKWLLPGGSLKAEHNLDYVDALMAKIRLALGKKENISVRNMFPVAMLTNIFINPKKHTHAHVGIGWVGFICSSNDLLEELAKDVGNFENNFIPLPQIKAEEISQAPNRNVFSKLAGIDVTFVFDTEGNLNKFGQKLHNWFVRPLLSFWKGHKLAIQRKIQEINPQSFIDVSCGDDGDLLFYLEGSKPHVVVLNDVSPEMVSIIKMSILRKRVDHPKTAFAFTMHDATKLANMKDGIFDVVLCKNTLHHFSSINVKEKCLDELKRICRKRLLIMDVEYPKTEARSTTWCFRGLVHLRHWHYMKVVGESGPKNIDTSFLSFEDFVTLIGRKFPASQFLVKFERIRNPRAAYMLAIVDRRLNE